METNSQQQQAEWELSKENIQPLKSGRKASKLANISQPKDIKVLNEERQQFETELRFYDGPDPLDPWYRYISWVEQEYPKGGKEGNIPALIESCIKKFKDEKSVHNDSRFLEIWLKYAAISSKPLEVFDFMFNNGLCSQKAGLYEAWAWYLETSKAFKKAESVFKKGIAAMTDTESKERLTMRQKQFQQRVIRRMNGEEIPDEEVEEEKRSALGQLRGHGKHGKVASVRVGQAKLGGPGVLQVGAAGNGKQPLRTNNSQAGFTIFSDENSAPVTQSMTSTGRQHFPSKSDSKENEMAAGPWTKAKIVKSSQNVPLDSISQYSKPAFTVYEEPNIAQPNQTPQRKIMPAENNVLSTRKDQKWDISCPVALFEKPDPTKKSMYCKEKVYQGTTEFSFEELRALRWKDAMKQQEEMEMMERRKQELMAMELKLKQQQEEMERKMAEFQRMMSGGAQALVQGNPGLMLTKPSTSSSTDDNDEVFMPQTFSRQPSLDTTANLLAANPSTGRNISSQSTIITTPSPHHSLNKMSSQPSPTVNTKEAMAAMQALWSKPVGEETEQDPQPLQTSGQAAPFQIYSDSDSKPAASSSSSTPFEIFCDTENVPPPAAVNTAPFAIFCDENAGQAAKLPPVNRRSRSDMLNRQNSQDKENSPPETDDEDRENMVPPGYTQPSTGARPKTGILTEAKNVEFIPLDVQEKMLDEEERREEMEAEDQVFKSPKSKLKKVNKPSIPKPFGGNQTIMLPNEDDFERMAKMSSTPYTGKPMFQFEQDENTCAVNILYKDTISGLDTSDNDMGPPASSVPDVNRLDTIVETSREYYKSSSSSSGGDTLHQNTNRSHWGNTGHSQLHAVSAVSAVSGAAGLSLALASVTSVSGYLGDKSTNVTKSGVKDNKRELIASPQVVPSFEKRMKIIENKEEEEEEDAFDEPTGMFSDMMAELKKNIVQKEHENSVQASFLEDPRDRSQVEIPPTPNLMPKSNLNLTGATKLDITGAPRLDSTGAHRSDITGVPKLDITGAPRLDITGAPRLNITGAPRLDITGAPRLDITGAPRLDITGAPRLDITGAPRLDITHNVKSNLDSTSGPSLDLTSEEVLASQTANLSLDETMDPFHPTTHTNLLASLRTPVSSLHGYVASHNKPMPNVRVKGTVSLGEDVFYVSECKGEGGYAKVFAATRQDDDMDCTITGIDAVLKVQKPANDWEFYICTQVQQRLPEDLAPAFMAIPRNYAFNEGSIFVSYHQKFGTLLDIVNIVKNCQVGKSCIEPMAMYFTIELLKMVEALHSIGIIHADLKADNLMLQTIPSLDAGAKTADELFEGNPLSLQLIDFGRSIDTTLLPAGTSFSKVVKCTETMCTEMREGKHWREHIDYYGVAAVSYCLLFQNYIEVVQIDGRWEVKGSFKRWWHQDLWRQFFGEMINIPGVEKENLPSLTKWRKIFEKTFHEKDMTRHLKSLTNDVMKAMMTSS